MGLKYYRELIIWLIYLVIASDAFCQGVTTSSVSGRITDRNGNPVYAVNVVAVHQTTNTTYGGISQADGYYRIINMRIGGPYKITVSHIGYKKNTRDNIILSLNQTKKIDYLLIEETTTLDEIDIIFNTNALIDPNRKGASTNITRKQISEMPTINRSQKDLTRLTPQADGYSFGGRNNLYNNFSVDGSIFNNLFGLEYATPGGQADAQPVSINAIEQIEVSIAPFDVRQGAFTGAGVNAVTKSGTNEFQITAFSFMKNDLLIGKKVGNSTSPNTNFSSNLIGLTLGGPILKNKLFFFLSLENEQRTGLAHGWVADNQRNTGEPNVTTVLESDLIRIQSRFRNYWNYDPGSYQGYNHKKLNTKILGKLNWNLASNQHISVRFNMLDAWKDILPHPEAVIGRGPTSYRLPFENSSARVYNKLNSIVGEWSSTYGYKWSNKLIAGYTTFRDTREPKSVPFPVIDIFDTNGNLAITMGSEMFSTNNVLNQNVFHLTDDVVYFADKHTISGGISIEKFHFENCFNLFYYPWNTFNSVDEFLNNKKLSDPEYNADTDIDFNQQVIQSISKPYHWSYLDIIQLAVYIQDEFQLKSNLNLSIGIRLDKPVYLSNVTDEAAQEAINFKSWVNEEGEPAQVNPQKWPNSMPLWSPRIGFNWDILGKSTLQLRGGSGIFTGRIPFVWLGNQASNPGIYPGYTFQVNATVEDFKYPQVWKTNIAVDWKVKESWILGLEGIWGADINAVVHRNYNMLPPSEQLTGTGDNRKVFSGFKETNIYSSDANAIAFLDAGAIILDNTNEGFQYSITAKVEKMFDFGLQFTTAYTYLNSKDYTSIPAEIAADAFQRNTVVGNPNTPELSWSRYGRQHRLISSAFYSVDYGFMSSTFGFFFESAEGNRYSFVYAGDLNQDAILNNDLLYIPENSSDINFGTVDENGEGISDANASAQSSAFFSFVEQDKYLKSRKGKYAERNGAILPWVTKVDLKYIHEFRIKMADKISKIQLSLDVINLGNLINSNWGIEKLPRTLNPLSVQGVSNAGVPYFRFDERLVESYIQDVSINSKWQMQFGLKYIFN